MIKNVFIKSNEQNDARINSAIARKGGCEKKQHNNPAENLCGITFSKILKLLD